MIGFIFALVGAWMLMDVSDCGTLTLRSPLYSLTLPSRSECD